MIAVALVTTARLQDLLVTIREHCLFELYLGDTMRTIILASAVGFVLTASA